MTARADCKRRHARSLQVRVETWRSSSRRRRNILAHTCVRAGNLELDLRRRVYLCAGRGKRCHIPHRRLAHAKNDVAWSSATFPQNRTTMTTSQRSSSIRRSAHRRPSPSPSLDPLCSSRQQPVNLPYLRPFPSIRSRPRHRLPLHTSSQSPVSHYRACLRRTGPHWDRGAAVRTESSANVTQSFGR